MTLTDEQYALHLRSRAAVAAPPMSLDVRATVHLGTRRRRRRRWGASLAVTAGIVSIAIAGLSVLDAPHSAVPVAAQQPRSVGTSQVVDLAAGVTASNALVATTDSLGRPWWDTGLHFEDPYHQDHLSVGFAPYDEAVGRDRHAVLGRDGIAQGVDDGTGSALKNRWPLAGLIWSRDAGPDMNSGGFVTGDAGQTGEFAQRSYAHVLAGTVPTWITDPRVALVFPRGASGVGSTSIWVEVPTFADPEGSGRLLFAVLLQPGTAWDGEGVPPNVYVVAGDGSGAVASDLCRDGARRACVPRDPSPALSAAIATLSGR
jgi:hypothetical protein